MKTFILFTGKSCPACATMKANMAKAGIEYEEINVDTNDGMKKAMEYHVSSLPTLAIKKIDGVLKATHPGALPVSELEKIKGR